MIENDISINSNGNRLSATVCLPEGESLVPSVLMIHGTGPLDRNENMKGQRMDVFNSIAHHLATAGIASLRYDKRGCGRSSGDYYRAGNSDLVDDAINCADVLGQFEFCDPSRLFVLGHSEGCIIAPQVSAKRPNVAGLILLCPFVDRIESILIKQATQIQREFDRLTGVRGWVRRLLARLMGMTVASQLKLIQRLKVSDADTMRTGFQKVPAKSFRELIRLEPSEIFGRVSCPVLVIGGEKDLQCDPADVHQIAGLAKGPATAHVVPNLTHVLRCDAGTPAFLSSGELLRKPLETVVLDLISAWLSEQCCIEERLTNGCTSRRPLHSLD